MAIKEAPRILIETVYPTLDDGRYPVKREVGDTLEVWADILKDGHEVLAAAVKYRPKGEAAWREAPMRHYDNDRWTGSLTLEENARYVYTIEAWTDTFASWLRDLDRRAKAGQDVASELLAGAALVRQAAEGAPASGPERRDLATAAALLEGGAPQADRVKAAMSAALATLVARYAPREDATRYDRELEVMVDRVRARFAAWYELFPRSQGRVPGRHGTFQDCIARLDDIQAMGFDTLYLPPIHPVGRTKRKGRNNALVAGPDDPGSPWAIGNEHGGHKAIEPALGTLEDFRHLVEAARARGIEIALDYALQCSPDHPYAREHPEWFFRRPDGTVKYAENPPKKYEDIYPINFWGPDWRALWEELLSVFRFWVQQGVRVFRVDNPHTKPFAFWHWAIEEIQAEHPDVLFLSEAFTRPKVMRALAKAGFTQSYTYFTWRNTKRELIDYLTELTQTEVREYMRGNLFANTPDILPPYLQEGGRPAFKIRLVLAATLSSVYGIYSGFELCENAAIPGREEYLDSEKYEIKVRDWDAPGNIKDYIARVNRVRREHPALQEYDNLSFYTADDDAVLFYGKRTRAGDDMVLVAVNLDFRRRRETILHLPLEVLDLPSDRPYRMRNLLSGEEHMWQGRDQRVWLDPRDEPAFVFTVRP